MIQALALSAKKSFHLTTECENITESIIPKGDWQPYRRSEYVQNVAKSAKATELFITIESLIIQKKLLPVTSVITHVKPAQVCLSTRQDIIKRRPISVINVIKAMPLKQLWRLT